MKSREKRLAMVVGGLVLLCALVFLFRAVMISPLRAIDRDIRVAQGKLDKLGKERRAYFAAEDQLKKVAQRSFAEETDQASARAGEMLTGQILASGLSDLDFTRLPVGPRRMRGAEEIGWSVHGDGPLSMVINLIYLLEQSPYVHRVENLAVSSGEKPGKVNVSFKYLTLVLAPPPLVEPIELPSPVSLETPDRKRYELVVQRDLFSPYLPAAPPPAPAPEPVTPAPPGPETFRVVSLSEWQGVSEVHVRDMTLDQTARYQAGDELAGGKIVLVDYRGLPLPGHPGLMSYSRVIVRIDVEYWAIERGQTLADKYRLQSDQLPEQLAKN